MYVCVVLHLHQFVIPSIFSFLYFHLLSGLHFLSALLFSSYLILYLTISEVMSSLTLQEAVLVSTTLVCDYPDHFMCMYTSILVNV